MELRQYLALARKWWWLAVLGMVLAGGTAYLVTASMSPVYQARTVLLINQARSPVTDYTSIIASQRLAETYIEVIRSRPVMEEVQKNLGLPYPPSVGVNSIRDTQLLEITVVDMDPARARAIANEVAAVFIRQNDETQRLRFASSRQSLEAQMTQLTKDIEATTKTLEAYKNGLAGANLTEDARQTEIKRLESIRAQYQNSYASLLRSYETLRLTEAQTVNTVTVMEPADLPRYPVGPRKTTNTLLAAAVGLALAVGVAFLVEYLDDTLKTSADVQSVLALPTLGSIARINPAKSPAETLIVAAHPKSHVAEAYRVLRTNIEFSSVDEPVQTLMVTSSGPTEGKSTTVANLGVAMAEAGKRVIVVDSDLRRPVQHKLFQVTNAVGLTSLLMADAPNVAEFLTPTAVENLRLVTCGPIPPNPAELLGSKRMANAVRLLLEHADVVLFDSPPTLAVTDAAVLGAQVDGVLLVVDAGVTRRGEVEQAQETLKQVGVPLLGVVLNRLKLGRGGYGYYYYYSSGGADHKRRGRRSAGGVRGRLERLRDRLPFVGG